MVQRHLLDNRTDHVREDLGPRVRKVSVRIANCEGQPHLEVVVAASEEEDTGPSRHRLAP